MSFLNFTSQKRAIAYYRHSAEDKQENSVGIQRDHAQKFARENNIEIIHEEADEGKSGLSADRMGFQRLLSNWVLNDDAPTFEYVLVYDVSRWGRFQNPDEAAMYQYQCTKRGKKLIFVDKGMPREDQALITHLQTSIERYMAADYSRQLSNKVFYGSAKISEQGYSAGGAACYGMTRLLLDINKQPIRTLKLGEHKQISNERVTFIPSNDETTQTVKEIFDLCVTYSHDPRDIAKMLNEKGIMSAKGSQWNREKILRVLTNETYTGTRIYNKRWGRLKQKSKSNPRNEWIVCTNAFPAIVSPETFRIAQEKLGHFVPSRSRQTVYSIHKLRCVIYDDLKNLLRNKNIDEDDINFILHNFPMTFSAAFLRRNIPHWCFTITEKMRNFDAVIAVGLDSDGKNYSGALFSIPINMFNQNNFVIFSKEEKIYFEMLLQKDQIAEKLQDNLDMIVNMMSIHRTNLS
jgi:DNA invertase Pin-like site-specific DNA recombinase